MTQRARRALWVTAGLAILAVLVWLVAPSPPEVGSEAVAPEAWKVPTPVALTPAPAAEGLVDAGLWGTLQSAGSAAEEREPSWRILGVVRSGARRFVLVKIDGQPERQLGVRDKLPGGSEILGIEDDSLCLLVNGTRRRLSVYPLGPQVL